MRSLRTGLTLAFFVVSATASAQSDPAENGRGSSIWGRGIAHERPSIRPSSRDVYRGSAKPPDETFRDGFDPLGSNPNLRDHVAGKKRDSVYVPTSSDIAIAAEFANSKRGNIYVVDDTRTNGVDANRAVRDNPYAREQEIAMRDGIDPGRIKGAWVPNGDKWDWVGNPDYRPVVPSWNTDAVVAKDLQGRLYDLRTGKSLTDAEAADAIDRASAYEVPRGITILRETGAGAIGMTVGPFENGRANLLRGDLGELNLDAARAEGSYDARVRAVAGGVDASVLLKGQVTLVGLHAQTKTFALGDPNSLTHARAGATANAFIGADGTLDGNVALTREKVAASARVSAFAGAKAQADVTGGVSICGIALEALGHGEVSAGIGAEAAAYFKIDWSTMTAKVGGKLAATLGLGGGVGGEVEVSLDGLVRDPAAAARCMAEGAIGLLRDGAKAVGSVLSDVGKKLCFFCSDDDEEKPVAGFNGARNASTRPTGTSTGRSPDWSAGTAR